MQLYDLSLAASGLTQAGAEARGVSARSTTIVQDFAPTSCSPPRPSRRPSPGTPRRAACWGAPVPLPPRRGRGRERDLHRHPGALHIDQLANVDLFFQPNFCQPVNLHGAVAMQAVAEQNTADASSPLARLVRRHVVDRQTALTESAHGSPKVRGLIILRACLM